jgi:ATP-dependent DNA helicase RecQ
LHSLGFKATYYHGGLTSREKDKNMQLWMDDKAQVIVATNAFGMGIDKADVKTVIHPTSENIENYYQKQVDLAEMEKSICGTSNESF